MKQAREWIMLGLIAVVALAVSAFFGFELVVKQRRAQTLAKIKKPASIALYEELAARSEDGAVGERSPAPVEEAVDPERDRQDASETLARYQELFAWEDERPQDVKTWEDLLDDVLGKHRSEWTSDERARLEAFLQANQDLIREIRELAGRGGPAYPLDFSKGFNIELPHLAKVRNFARLLQADAIGRAMTGDYAGAVDDLLAGMKLSEAVADEPILISQLVRIAMDGIMYDAFQNTFDPGECPPDLARELLRQAARGDNRDAFADSFLGEQHMGLATFSQLQESGWLAGLDYMEAIPGRDGMGRFSLFLYTSPLARPWQHMDEQDYAEIMSRLADAARLPFYEAKPMLDQVEDDIEHLPRTRVLSRTLLPALTRAVGAQAQHEVLLDMLQLGITLEQYYTEHGEYPETLDAIAPDLGGTIPVDPYTGEPYHYEPQSDTCLLYSVGRNLVDDGGHHDYREGDIVWRGEKG